MPRKATKLKYLDKDKALRESWSNKYKGAEIKRAIVSGGRIINGESVTNDGWCTGLYLSNTLPGTTVSTRIGNQIRPLGLRGAVHLSLVQPQAAPIAANLVPQTVADTTPTTLSHHVMVVLDRQSNGIGYATDADVNTLFRQVFTTLPGTGQVFVNYDNKDRFDILFHKTVILHNLWQPTKVVRYKIPLDLFNTTYPGGVGAGSQFPITNSLFVFVYNGGDPPFVPSLTQTQDIMYLSRASISNELYFVDL